MPRVLALGHAPALVMHGGADEVVPVRDAYALAQAMGTRAELHVIPGADHLGNPHLAREVAFAMTWLAKRLR